MANGPRPTSSSRRRTRRRTPQAGDRLEHEGRHAEHLTAHLERVVDLLGPAPGAGDLNPAGATDGDELDDEGGDEE